MTVKTLCSSVVGLLGAILDVFKKLVSLRPIEYFKGLTNKNNPHSSHRFVNLIWGCGSFFMFWAISFIQVTRDVAFRFGALEYTFIGAMAGISTISAIVSKKKDQPKTPCSDTVASEDDK